MSIFISRIKEALVGVYVCSQSVFQIIWLFALWGVDLAPAVQKVDDTIHQAPVVQTLDSAIHRINHYPAPHKYNLGETDCTIHRIEIYPVDSAIQPLKNRGQINYYPLDSTIIGFPKTYPLDSDLSSG